MKAFIVLALVACVAARSVDIDTLRFLSKEKSLLSRDDLLLNKDNKLWSNTHRFSLPKKTLLSSSYDYPTQSYYGDDDVESWTQRRVTILSLEELVSTPLFREYLQIPLFRQFYEQYPTVFRRYVESPLFQQFWTVPQFQMYFRNPIFFYKYIVPQVQIIAQNVPYTSEGDFYNYDKYNTGYSYDKYNTGYNYDVQDYVNTPRHYGQRDITVEEYLNKIFGHGIDRTSTYVPRSVFPYAYGKSYPTFDRYSSPIFAGRQYYGDNAVNYKFLLDKIYKTLFVNKPTVGEVTQVRTDVKVAPAHKEIVVEPVTGESKVVYEPTKIVDVKVDEKIIPSSEYHHTTDVEDVIVKESLLKRLLITKRITPELYSILKNLPLHHVREIVRRIVSPSVVDVDSVYGEDVTFPTRHYEDINNVDFNDVVYRHRINEIVNQLYKNELVGERHIPVVRDLLKVLGGHHTTRDVLPTTWDEVVRV
ncbi:uncharacterized protein LOC110854001 [Folsomia candida]|uniref:Uncharacterized protein n=1 Tax=Folsomia candida TaxID=158441 RepID=A0A226DXJ1_FOLCA|nr:uncharacterized protein LOC110854001 [Folsomia candida]OXA50182.1 hypothetical protein Fcan01_15132 [Folsomia candida]